jgi:HTH-type transcriptional regulator/antitoxin HigA
MDIKLLKNEDDYSQALDMVELLLIAEEKGALAQSEADEIEILLMLIEKYEAEHWAIDAPDPIEAIKFRMEQQGLSRKDLEGAIGHRGRISEVLSGKRSLTLEMIRKLHSQFKIPLEILINRPNTA